MIKEDCCASESKQMSPRVHKVARDCSGRRSISTEAAKQVPPIGGTVITGLVRAVRPTVLLKTLPGGGRISDKLESDPEVKKIEVKNRLLMNRKRRHLHRRRSKRRESMRIKLMRMQGWRRTLDSCASIVITDVSTDGDPGQHQQRTMMLQTEL